MRTFIIVTWVVLMVLSIIARVISKRKSLDHPLVAVVGMADMALLFIGTMLVGLANVGSTNQFAKYMDGYPNVDAGGLSPGVLFGNLFIFALPLMIVVFTRAFWSEWKKDMALLFNEPPHQTGR